MSYYKYSSKRFLKTSTGLIFPICQIADSSVRDRNGKCPKHLSVFTAVCKDGTILASSETIREKQEEAVRKQMDLLMDYCKKYGGQNPEGCSLDDLENYYGTVYNGRRSLAAMKSFMSPRRTILAEKFLMEHPIIISIESYDRKSFKTESRIQIRAEHEPDLIYADSIYRDFCKIKEYGTCIGIEIS